jgi:hypothetical protein
MSRRPFPYPPLPILSRPRSWDAGTAELMAGMAHATAAELREEARALSRRKGPRELRAVLQEFVTERRRLAALWIARAAAAESIAATLHPPRQC